MDGCMFGMRHPRSGGLVRKRWRIMTSDARLAESLNARCCGRTHRHDHLIGSVLFRHQHAASVLFRNQDAASVIEAFAGSDCGVSMQGCNLRYLKNSRASHLESPRRGFGPESLEDSHAFGFRAKSSLRFDPLILEASASFGAGESAEQRGPREHTTHPDQVKDRFVLISSLSFSHSL